MAESSSGGGATEISLSIEETNKLRAKLGLKPLQLDGNSSVRGRGRDERGSNAVSSQGTASSVSVPHLGDAAASETEERGAGAEKSLRRGDDTEEERRRALRAQRERTEEARRKATHAAFTQGLTIAEQQRLEDEDCDPVAWIAHMRRKEAREKLVLASQGKLDVARYDSDEEEEAGSSPHTAAGQQERSSTSRRDVDNRLDAASRRKRGRGEIGRGEEAEEEEEEGTGGLRVVHGLKDIQEGEDVVLTLKDARILTAEGDLNEDGDTLESVQLVEKERLQKRLKAKARLAVYDPTAEEEEEGTEEGGGKKEKEILKHYDEWEEEQLEAQGKTSRKERETGFVLPDLQHHGIQDVVEVPLHRLKAAGPSGPQPARGRGKRSGRDEIGDGEGTKWYGAGAAKKGIQYDASGPSSVVLGEEFDARQEEEVQKPVTFRKVSKKKISKKKHGSDFWKDLFGESLAVRDAEGEAEEGESGRSGDDSRAAPREHRKDRHHGSRKDRVDGEAERRGGAQQKQSVRDALDRAAETVQKQRADSSSSSSPSYSSSRLKGERRKSSGGAAAGEDTAESQRRRRTSQDFRNGDRPLPSPATGDASVEKISGMPEDEDEMLLEEDRLLREQLERQRRLAGAKLLEQRRLKVKGSKENQDEEGQTSAQSEDDATEDKAQLFRKLPQARLLELLNRAQKTEPALLDARPTDIAGGAESSLRGASRSSSVQQQNNATRTATAMAAGSASVGSLVMKEEEAEEDEGGGLQISTTTEFCRTVQTPLEKLQTMKQEVFAGARLFRQQKAAQTQGRSERSNKVSKGGASGASSVADNGSKRGRKEEGGEGVQLSETEGREARRRSKKAGKVSDGDSDAGDDSDEMEIDGEKNSVVGGTEKEKKDKAEEEEDDDDDELDDVAFMNETPMGHGIAETLKYLQSKNHYSLDKMRQRRHRPDELPLHKPVAPNEIKIDHRDMYGNVMTPKNAFRQISWRFHGKYPSLNKQEKQARKMHLERKLLKNPMEALPTLNALQKLQQTEKTFHMVLTGGSLGDRGRNR